MSKSKRQKKVAEIITQLNVANQDQLQSWLAKAGVVATQASLSRDLRELGAVKVNGHYRLPEIIPGQSRLVSKLKAERAGENLVVLKTDPLQAPALAALIDRSSVTGVAGTIAGDDTVFVALTSRSFQNKVIRKIISLVKGGKK